MGYKAGKKKHIVCRINCAVSCMHRKALISHNTHNFYLNKKITWAVHYVIKFNKTHNYIRGLTDENSQLAIKCPIGYFKSHLGIFIQLWIGDFSSLSVLAESNIPNPQLGILSPTGDLICPIGDIMPDWGYSLFVVYYSMCLMYNMLKCNPRFYNTCVSSRHSRKCITLLKLMTELMYFF